MKTKLFKSIKRSSIVSALSLIFCFVQATVGDEVYGEGYDVYVTAGAVTIHDENILLMTWPAGANKTDRALFAVDIRDPAAPRLRDRLTLDGFPQGLAMQGNHAYVVNGLDLLVVDVGNAGSLTVRSQLRIAEDPVYGPQGLAVAGETVWLACRRGGVKAVDVSDPDNPQVVGETDADAFVREIAVVDGTLYAAADTRGIFVFDVETLSAPRKITRLPMPRGGAGRLRIMDQVAYIAGGNVLVGSLSLENAREPEWLGSTEDRHVLSPYFGSYACDLDIGTVECRETGGQLALTVVADAEGGLIVSDVSRPESPAFLGALKGGDGPDIATGVVLRDNLAYVTDESYGLRVVDVSRPHAPKPVGTGLNLRE